MEKTHCGLPCCCMCGWKTTNRTFVTFDTQWMLSSSPPIITSQFFSLLTFDALKKIVTLHSPPFILGDWHPNITSCLHVIYPLREPISFELWISLILLVFSAAHYPGSMSRLFDDSALRESSDFWTTLWWKHVACRDNTDSAECWAARMVQSQRASSGTLTNLHFYTCLPSLLAHVSYRTHTGFVFFSSPSSFTWQSIENGKNYSMKFIFFCWMKTKQMYVDVAPTLQHAHE